MKSAIETHLWDRIPLAGANAPSVRDVIAAMKSDGLIDNEKQAWRTLEKWAKKGKYEYGVALDLGWKIV